MQNDQPTGKERAREKDGEEVTALARGLDVLRRIAAADAPVSNRELTDWTGIPKPTVSRITATLVGAGLLYRLPDSERFVLTASVLELSNGFLRNFDIRARARPFLIQLAERTGLSVHLAVRDRLEMVVIDAIRPRSAVLVSRLEVGGRMDLTRTSVGRAYLAVLAEADRRALIGSLQTASGDEWPSIASSLHRGLDDALRRGFAMSVGEWHDGLNAVAAGFVGPSEERYAVNCGGAAYQCPRDTLIDIVAPALLECVGHIVREIGGTYPAPAAHAAG
ncbi:IclR family transcriptional regulator [Caballeronia sp. LZ065]|uniref:IclR family transcriptional regulator n=1 Tax=Caballeronia sp. LZ065 TaxID=3038571 RepID=UPI0028655F1B|nr:IclR family transcriptional regulator [Caballeronia sp. LZ065]MDR5778974.1 IclR family transcriptional regulator [Caballeronia sp. LZ065]